MLGIRLNERGISNSNWTPAMKTWFWEINGNFRCLSPLKLKSWKCIIGMPSQPKAESVHVILSVTLPNASGKTFWFPYYGPNFQRTQLNLLFSVFCAGFRIVRIISASLEGSLWPGTNWVNRDSEQAFLFYSIHKGLNPEHFTQKNFPWVQHDFTKYRLHKYRVSR